MSVMWCVKCALRATLAATLLVGAAHSAIDVQAWKGDEPITPEKVVNELVEYFSQPDPHGIPVLQVPDVIQLPESVAVQQITLTNAQLSGHSGIRLEYVNINLTSLSGTVRISVPHINVKGDYEWPGYFTNSKGEANITIVGIDVTLELYLGVSSTGVLTVDDLQIELNYEDLALDFTNLAYLHSTQLGAVQLFISPIKTAGINLAEGTIRTRLNEAFERRLGNFSLPDSVSPVDFALAKARGLMRPRLEPVMVDQISYTWGATFQLKNVMLEGLSTIHRTHEISAQFIDSTAFVTIQLGTQRLRGGADLSVAMALLPAVGGHLELEIEFVSVTVEAKQPANIRSPPTLRKIDVQLGNIQLRSSGEGTLDYLAEMAVNIVPNALRNSIMDKIEPKIHQLIQKMMNRLDVYALVMKSIQKRGARSPYA